MFMRRVMLALVLVAAYALPAWSSDYKREAGPHAVTTTLGEWHDADRDRDVPYKIYAPSDMTDARPVVIFSHGLGGSREGSAYLGKHLASYGYIAVHIQHPGSDESIWKGKPNPYFAIREWMKGTRNLLVQSVSRFKDLPFAIDQLAAMNASDATFKGRFDMSRIGMSGHSFGAHSTMAASGQLYGGAGMTMSYADNRIKASIAYSPTVPQQRTDYDVVYSKIAVPIFHMTGTDDGDVVGNGATPETRQMPFRNISATDQYLLVLDGGDHMLFSGTRAVGVPSKPTDEAYLALIREASIAYWDTYLMGDETARKWLQEGGFAEALGKQGTFEMKLKK